MCVCIYIIYIAYIQKIYINIKIFVENMTVGLGKLSSEELECHQQEMKA